MPPRGAAILEIMMNNQDIIKSLEALKEQHRTGAAVLLEAAQHFARAVASQRDVECQDIDRLIRSLRGTPENTVPAAAPVPESAPETPAPAANRTLEQEKQLADLRAACVAKAAAGGQKEILLFLQNHGARTIYELSPDFYPDLLKICQEVC